MPAPLYSVVLSAYRSERTLRAALEGLRRQRLQDFETIVVDSSPDDAGALIVREFPEVRLLRPSRRLWPHAARNAGAAVARGTRLIFTDPDCVAKPDWLTEHDASFRAGHRLVGGPIACGSGNWRGRAIYLAKFWRWLPRSDSGLISDLPSGNLGVERDLFQAVGGVPEWHMSGDTEFCLRVARHSGRPAWFNDRAVTTHDGHAHGDDPLAERLRRGRAFGALRSRQPEWHPFHSAALVLGWPLLTVAHLIRKSLLCRSRGLTTMFLMTWPLVLALDAAWMLGQAQACVAELTGRGYAGNGGDRSDARLSDRSSRPGGAG